MFKVAQENYIATEIEVNSATRLLFASCAIKSLSAIPSFVRSIGHEPQMDKLECFNEFNEDIKLFGAETHFSNINTYDSQECADGSRLSVDLVTLNRIYEVRSHV
jgi:hypothetical protein